MFFVMNGER